jgi:hypothetical protein
MADQIIEDAPVLQDTEDSSNDKKTFYYPLYKHSASLSFVNKIYTDLGHYNYHSRDAIAVTHKLAPNSVRSMLATAQYFRLLEIKHGTGYKVSETFIKIIRPIDDIEKNNAILESLKSPVLWKELFKVYENHVVPVTGLTNSLVRNYHVNERIAGKVSDIFIQSLKEYGLININNILTTYSFLKGQNNSTALNPAKEVVSDSKPETNKPLQDDKKYVNNPQADDKNYSDLIDIIIPLKSTTEKAHLLLPTGFTEDDLARISKFVEALK